MRDQITKLYDKFTLILDSTIKDDEYEVSNIDFLIQKYILALRRIDVTTTESKDLSTNINKLAEFFNLYDKLNTTAIQRQTQLETSQTAKLEAIAKTRQIKAVVVDFDDDNPAMLDNEIESETEVTNNDA